MLDSQVACQQATDKDGKLQRETEEFGREAIQVGWGGVGEALALNSPTGHPSVI